MRRAAFIMLAAVAFTSASASAQSSALAQAIADGRVGERFDGYLGFTGTPSDQLRREVVGINIQRRNLYTELATRRGVTPDLIGRATACQLFSRLSPGEPYLPDGGNWRRYLSGQPAPIPEHCR